MEQAPSAAQQQLAPNAWAPGAVRMTVFTVLTVAVWGLPNFIRLAGYDPFAGPSWVGVTVGTITFGLFIAAAVLAHTAYQQANRVVRANPNVRGAWLVRNLWWVVLAGMVAVPAAAMIGLGLVLGLGA